MYNVYIGWDNNEIEAYRVAEYSIRKNTECEVDVKPLIQRELRKEKMYWRGDDDLAATEFSLTRFLVPHLNHFQGWALFIDCDMLFTKDIDDLFLFADDSKAIMCVQHNHQPFEETKMVQHRQHKYRRKNWSSVMLFNCGHPKNRNLTADVVNSVQPSFLHQMEWLKEADIGELPLEWNWLEGYYTKLPKGRLPANIHYTRGGPWFENWQDVDYGDVWREYHQECKEQEAQ